MRHVALVMGFGFGQANDDVAEFVFMRKKLHGDFDVILSQSAVIKPLRDRGLTPEEMHGRHDNVYVDTLDAAGFGLLKLKDLLVGEDEVEIEVIAHERQQERAHNAATLAKRYLSPRPSMGAFLDSAALPEIEAPVGMCLNQWRWPPEHFWTYNAHVYSVADATLIAWRFNRKRKCYEQDATAIYRSLSNINDELRKRGVHWKCGELP